MKKFFSLLLVTTSIFTLLLCGCNKEAHTVTIYASRLTQEELDDIDGFAKENGYISARYSKKEGLVYLTLDDTDYNDMMYSIGLSIIRNVYGMIDSEEYPYIKEIKRNDNFSDINVFVNKSDYEKDGQGDLIATFIGNCCLMYLKNDTETKDKNKKCTVTIYDRKTEEILTQQIFSVND